MIYFSTFECIYIRFFYTLCITNNNFLLLSEYNAVDATINYGVSWGTTPSEMIFGSQGEYSRCTLPVLLILGYFVAHQKICDTCFFIRVHTSIYGVKNTPKKHPQKQIFIIFIYKSVKVATKHYWNLIDISSIT